MALTTPVISNVLNFDATKSYTFEFMSIGGSQVIRHNIVIYNNETNSKVYDSIVESFQYKHILAANVLTNTNSYRVQLRTGDIYGRWSEFSDWKLFSCYQPADISITNISDGIANNQNFQFSGEYTSHGDDIASYLFILYDENGVQLDVSPISYTLPIQASFVLQNQTNYKIELKCYSQSGNTLSSGLIPFMAVYLAPVMGAEIQLTNLKDQGAVEVEIIAIDRVAEGENYSFIDSDWVNITDSGSVIKFKEGLNTITSGYSIKLYAKNIQSDIKFLEVISAYGKIEIKYSENRFHAWQTASNLISHFMNNDDISVSSTDIICLEIRYINGLVDVYASNLSNNYLWNSLSGITWDQLSSTSWDSFIN
jgi:hypothetical protein